MIKRRIFILLVLLKQAELQKTTTVASSCLTVFATSERRHPELVEGASATFPASRTNPSFVTTSLVPV